ncbi:hypothetical protein [Microbacterium sp. No. 7]|uniref:hypothetical protein n=1 Tax=Microbacterium sp. No. 7 TaxID=1714373 RepID=UPI0006D13A70|nr:hypothetical protein [Microbacterium sp. No. 7]ALJ21470.1 hypothetical protein AOA12_16860 [Microbacterium sp. No. 7]
MTRLLPLAAAAALLLSLTACSPSEAPADDTAGSGVSEGACADAEGVTLSVDASAIDAAPEQWCIPTDDTIAASDVLSLAGVTTEGTEEYGDQVVCRVDGVPAADQKLPNPEGGDYVEECAAMPAAFAYWSLWVKPAGGEWDYAQEGLSTLDLDPGDSLELLFSLNGEPAAPAS